MLRLATLNLELKISANSTTCRFSVWVLLVAILVIPYLCSMIPQIYSIDSCHNNLSRLLHRAPKYGGVSLRFRKTQIICCLWTKTVIYCLFDTPPPPPPRQPHTYTHTMRVRAHYLPYVTHAHLESTPFVCGGAAIS